MEQISVIKPEDMYLGIRQGLIIDAPQITEIKKFIGSVHRK